MSVPRGERRLGVELAVAQARAGVGAIGDLGGVAGHDRGQELERPAGLHPLDSGEGPELAQEALLVAVERGPRVSRPALPRPDPQKGRPPLLFGSVREPEALERDRQLDPVAVLDHLPLALEDQVEPDVLPTLGGKADVALDPGRVDEDLVPPGGVAVGVQDDPEEVVAEDLVAVADRGPDGGRIVPGDQRDVEVFVVVGDPRLALDRGLALLGRIVLAEPGRPRGALPAGIVQVPVDLDLAGRPRDLELRLDLRTETLAPRLPGGRLGPRRHRRHEKKGERHGERVLDHRISFPSGTGPPEA